MNTVDGRQVRDDYSLPYFPMNLNRTLASSLAAAAIVAAAGGAASAQTPMLANLAAPFNLNLGGFINGTAAPDVNTDVFADPATMDVVYRLDYHQSKACGELTGPELTACKERYRAMWMTMQTQLSRWMETVDSAFQAGFRQAVDQVDAPATIPNWYRIQPDGSLEVRSGMSGDFTAEPANRWRDASGAWFRVEADGTLSTSTDAGLTWLPSATNRWQGSDRAWYRLTGNGVLESSLNGTDWYRSEAQAWPYDGGTPMPLPQAEEVRDAERQAELLRQAWEECEERSPRTRGTCMREFVLEGEGDAVIGE
jgi:hypothetical protein